MIMEKDHMPSSAKRKTVLLVLVVITSIIYIGWRIFFTIPFDYGLVSIIFGIALVAAEGIAVIEAFSHYYNMRHSMTPEKPEIPLHMYPDVDVLVATHSEEAKLLYKTLNGCLHMDYPSKSRVHIYLCDDMDRPEMKQLADRMGVGYFGLSENKEAKAGNLNNALSKTHSPLVVTLDADMIPTSAFLMETVPYFALPKMIKEDGVWRERRPEEINEDEKIGFIQTPQSFYNADMFQFNLYADKTVPNEQDYFFREINIGRNRTNSVVYAGSNTVISREALEAVGGIRTGTITEDFATGMDIQAQGYTTYAIDKVVAHGLAPKDFKSLIKQRQRWARGCVQTLRGKKFLLSSLPFAAKMSYMVCLMYWYTFLRRFVYIISPILFVVFNIVVVDCTLPELLFIWLPSYLIYNYAMRVMSGNIRNVRWSNTVDTILFPYLILPVIAETFGVRMRKFYVTPKTTSTSRNSEFRYAIPHIVLAALSVVGLAYCIYDFVVFRNFGGIVVLYWLCVNLYTLVNAIIFIAGRINYRNDERFYANVPIRLRAGQWTLTGETSDLSEEGIAVLSDNPDYISHEDNVKAEIRYKGYVAEVDAALLHVEKMGGKWKYSFKITGADEENRRQYLGIVYDRHHSLPKVIQSSLLGDIKATLQGTVTPLANSNRKLPRIEVHSTVPTLENGPVEIVDFNYACCRIGRQEHVAPELTLLLDQEYSLHCKCVEGREKVDGSALYEIENWQALSAQPDTCNKLRDLMHIQRNPERYTSA